MNAKPGFLDNFLRLVIDPENNFPRIENSADRRFKALRNSNSVAFLQLGISSISNLKLLATMTIQKNYSVNFGTVKTGLTNVGYTLSGSPRSIFGVFEAVNGSGIYSAPISHDIAFVGSIVWDTGEASAIFAVEDINPSYLGANGLDAILVEPPTSGGQAIRITDSLSIVSAVLAGATTQDATTNTITFYAVGNPSVSRLTAVANDNNRQTVTPSIPSTP